MDHFVQISGTNFGVFADVIPVFFFENVITFQDSLVNFSVGFRVERLETTQSKATECP